MSSETLRNRSWQELRTYRVFGNRDYTEHVVPHGSWHFGFLMTEDEMRIKLCTNTDPIVRASCALPEAVLKQRVHDSIGACKDLFPRKKVPPASGRASSSDRVSSLAVPPPLTVPLLTVSPLPAQPGRQRHVRRHHAPTRERLLPPPRAPPEPHFTFWRDCHLIDLIVYA